MRIVITGAGGYVGLGLVQRLLEPGAWLGRPITEVVALDLQPPPASAATAERPAVVSLAGDMADPALLAQVFAQPVDVLFHLASIPGGTAEQQPALARHVNLEATQALLDAAQAQQQAGGPVVRLVFASSIAVFGALPAQVDDDTPTRPVMSYGGHKLIGELLVAEASRRGWIEGCSLRLPGVLARPPARTGQLSAFMSDLIRELAAGRPFTCPTSAGATIWAASRACTLDNLIHAALASSAQLAGPGGLRAFTLPVLRASMQALAQACGQAFGTAGADLVTWAPEPRIEALFGQQPPINTPAAEAAGFRHDGSLGALVQRALDQPVR
jgi:nucleoside-diphosphate-sugar epimerase